MLIVDMLIDKNEEFILSVYKTKKIQYTSLITQHSFLGENFRIKHVKIKNVKKKFNNIYNGNKLFCFDEFEPILCRLLILDLDDFQQKDFC